MKFDARSFKGLSRFLAPSAGGPLADRALAERIISPDQLEDCVREQDRTGKGLDEILVDRGFIKPDQLARLRQPALPAEAVAALEDASRVMNQYILVSTLGAGGMAEVWKAWDRSLGRWVAIKFLRPEIGHPTQRIEREGRMAGGLSHPNLISIFERAQQDGRPYLVMPYVEGSPPRTPLPPREAARVARDVALGLAHAHARGVIHRDVKPQNIIVGPGGHVVLMDFGLAIPDESATSRWAVSGTPEYASPEQVRGDPLDARTDIYSLGATLYDLLLGRPPYSGKDPQEIADQVLKGEFLPLKGAPPRLAAIVRRAMSPDPARRHATMVEFARDLREFIEGGKFGTLFKPLPLTVLVLAGALSASVTYVLLERARARDESLAVLRAGGQGQAELAKAERMRVDPEAKQQEVVSAVRRAMPLFTTALRLAGGYEPQANVGLGRCFELLGQEPRAEEHFKRAGASPAARLGLARIWLKASLEGRKNRNWKALTLALLEPARHAPIGDPQLPFYHLASGQAEQVLATGMAALQFDPHDEMIHAAMGQAAADLGRADAAVEHFERASKLRRWDPTLLYHRGLACAKQGSKDKAVQSLTESLNAPPDWPLRAAAEARLRELKP